MKKYVYIFLQCLSSIYNWSYIFFWRIKILTPKNFIVPTGPVLFIANHQSRTDPFIITVGVGCVNFFCKMLPTRYPATPDYMCRPIVGRLIAVMGGYDIGRTPLERTKKLLYTRDILNVYKQKLLIFPQGGIYESDVVDSSRFYAGIQTLFADPVPVVFVRLRGLGLLSSRTFFTKNNRSITYSEVVSGHLSTEEKSEIMKRFYA